MGSCGTKVFVVNDKAPGQNESAFHDFEILGLTKAEINKFYIAFCKMDVNRGGQIEISEFLRALDLEMTPLSNEVFSELDKSHDGHSDFREFTLSVWKFCSEGLDSIADMAFDIYDQDDSNSLTKVEIKNMIIEIYGRISPKHDVQLILNEFDRDKDSTLSRSEFKEMVKKNRNIVLPALTFQEKLRSFVGDETFWVTIEEKSKETKKRDDVKKLFQDKRQKVGSIRERMERQRSTKEENHFQIHGWHKQHHDAIHGEHAACRHSEEKLKKPIVETPLKKSRGQQHPDTKKSGHKETNKDTAAKNKKEHASLVY